MIEPEHKELSIRRQSRLLGVNRKRLRRLMEEAGIEAIAPKRWTSMPNAAHRKYPYLLRGLEINRPDQVWCSDI